MAKNFRPATLLLYGTAWLAFWQSFANWKTNAYVIYDYCMAKSCSSFAEVDRDNSTTVRFAAHRAIARTRGHDSLTFIVLPTLN